MREAGKNILGGVPGTEATYFADDTRVMRGIKSVVDCSILQADLLKVYEWACKHALQL